MSQLKSVLNGAAWLSCLISKFCDRSNYMWDELHWLPMQTLIVFKDLILMDSCLLGCGASSYLRELCMSGVIRTWLQISFISNIGRSGYSPMLHSVTVQHASFTHGLPLILEHSNLQFVIWASPIYGTYCILEFIKHLSQCKLVRGALSVQALSQPPV